MSKQKEEQKQKLKVMSQETYDQNALELIKNKARDFSEVKSKNTGRKFTPQEKQIILDDLTVKLYNRIENHDGDINVTEMAKSYTKDFGISERQFYFDLKKSKLALGRFYLEQDDSDSKADGMLKINQAITGLLKTKNFSSVAPAVIMREKLKGSYRDKLEVDHKVTLVPMWVIEQATEKPENENELDPDLEVFADVLNEDDSDKKSNVN